LLLGAQINQDCLRRWRSPRSSPAGAVTGLDAWIAADADDQPGVIP
jgi:hypothetical protein